MSFGWLGACGPDVVIMDSPGASGAPGAPVTRQADAGSPPPADFKFPPVTGMPAAPGPGAGGAPGLIAPGAPGAADGDRACAETKAETVRLPVDLYFVQDRSGSMAGAKWMGVKAALISFVQAPEAAGMQVGLGFFPRPPVMGCMGCTTAPCFQMCGCASVTCSNGVCTCGATGSASCNLADYVDAAVGIEALPAVSAKIVAALNATMLSGGTPTLPALEGAVQFAKTWVTSKNRRVALALVTDGEPTGCAGNTVASVSAVAQGALASGIPTFVIGVGPNLMNLNAMAAAGGTTKAFLIEGANIQQLFLDALKNIAGQVSRLSCSYAVPAPSMGPALDPKKVNVRFTGGEPPKSVDIGQVGDQSKCGAKGGWYYDDPTMPKTINLCDSSCQMVNQAGTKAEISVLFGCATRIID